MGKIEDAIKKINDEVQKNHSNTYLVMVGEHIIDNITTEDNAERVLAKDKTLQGCLSQIRTFASKQKKDNVAVIDDVTVYKWAREYFGLKAAEKKPHLEVVKMQTPAETPKEVPKKSGHLSLDDFGF